MHSFTFNSDIRIPSKGIRNSFLTGVLIALIITVAIEIGLRSHGMQPYIQDSKEIWAAQRTRASALGDKAVILVGASRILLGINLDILESELNLTSVQLAINGTSFIPVLEDLAADPKVTGTILVATNSGAIKNTNQKYKSSEWVEFYRSEYRGLLSPTVERLLKTEMAGRSAIYSSGLPISILLQRALGRLPVTKRYVKTKVNREHNADYQLVPQPSFYITRVIKQLGIKVDMQGVTNLSQAESRIRTYIHFNKPYSLRSREDYNYINSLTKQLEERGAQIVFIRFPTSGLVWEIDKSRLPRKFNWDQFNKFSKAPTIHFMDYPALQYPLADGSHLDVRQKSMFTTSLANIVKTKLAPCNI